jgi:hypothetical protein
MNVTTPFLELVCTELRRARTLHPRISTSAEESLEVFLEELHELSSEIYKKKPDNDKVLEELVQSCAMLLRLSLENSPTRNKLMLLKMETDAFLKQAPPIQSHHEGLGVVRKCYRFLEKIIDGHAVNIPPEVPIAKLIGVACQWVKGKQLCAEVGSCDLLDQLDDLDVKRVLAPAQPQLIVPN